MWAKWLERYYTTPNLIELAPGMASVTEAMARDSTFAARYFPAMLAQCLADHKCTLPIMKMIHQSWVPYLFPPIALPSPSSRTRADKRPVAQPKVRRARLDIPLRLFRRVCICEEAEDMRTGPCRIRGHDSDSPSGGGSGSGMSTSRIQPRFNTVQDVLDFVEFLSDPSSHSSFSIPGSSSPSSTNKRSFTTIYKPRFSGQTLALAVSAFSIRLVRYLIREGNVDPSSGDSVAVKAAFRKDDLTMVKLLIERSDDDVRDELPAVQYDMSPSEKGRPPRKRRRTSFFHNGKRSLLVDRVEVTTALLREALRVDARDVVAYFVDEKGCTPDARTLARTFFDV